MKRRILSLSIALLLAVQLLVPLACAAGVTLSLTAPDKLPSVGQTFTVTVDLSGNPGLSAVQLLLAYNAQTLECVSASTGSVLSGMLSASNPRAPGGAMIAAASASEVKTDGSVAVFKFKVKASGSTGFALQDIVLGDADGGELTYALGKNTPASPGTSGGTTGDKTGEKSDGESGEETEETGETGETSETGDFLAASFKDVPASYWASAQIARAAELGLVTGFADGSFRPNGSVTRAQFVTMLWRMAGQPEASQTASFVDVKPGDWYTAALDWAFENGYVTGTSGGRFDPNGPITRQQAMAILYRYAGSPTGMEAMLTGVYDAGFADSASVSAWAKPAVYWAIYNGVVTGATKTTIAPNATATRAQIAVIFLRYMEKMTANGEETVS